MAPTGCSIDVTSHVAMAAATTNERVRFLDLTRTLPLSRRVRRSCRGWRLRLAAVSALGRPDRSVIARASSPSGRDYGRYRGWPERVSTFVVMVLVPVRPGHGAVHGRRRGTIRTPHQAASAAT